MRWLAPIVLWASLGSSLAMGADLTGIWTGQIPGRNGGVDDVAFRFKLDGQTLSGKLLGDEFDIAIADASVKGDETVVQYSGTVKGAELELVRERVPQPDDRPTADAKAPQKQTIKLKRIT